MMTKYRLSDTSGPLSILCFSCLMIYHDTLHGGSRNMGGGARAEKGEGQPTKASAEEGMQHVRTAYLFL